MLSKLLTQPKSQIWECVSYLSASTPLSPVASQWCEACTKSVIQYTHPCLTVLDEDKWKGRQQEARVQLLTQTFFLIRQTLLWRTYYSIQFSTNKEKHNLISDESYYNNTLSPDKSHWFPASSRSVLQLAFYYGCETLDEMEMRWRKMDGFKIATNSKLSTTPVIMDIVNLCANHPIRVTLMYCIIEVFLNADQ